MNKDLHAGKSGNADISIKHFEFSKLQKFIPDETVINGEVNLDAFIEERLIIFGRLLAACLLIKFETELAN